MKRNNSSLQVQVQYNIMTKHFILILICAFLTTSSTIAFHFSASILLVDRREVIAGLVTSVLSVSTYSDPAVKKSSTRIDTAVAQRQQQERDPIDFSGLYTDPKLPSSYRIVLATGPGLVSVMLQDDPESKVVLLKGNSKYNKKTGETIIDKVAVYTRETGSITFPDGSTWVKDKGIQGIYIDPNYPDGYRLIRELGGAKLSIEVFNRPARTTEDPVRLSGVINQKEMMITFDYSYFSGPKKYVAKLQENQLLFPDNAWTKL